MSEFKVNIQGLNSAMDSTQQVEIVLQQAMAKVQAVKRNLRVQIRQREQIDSRLVSTMRQLEAQRQTVGQTISVGREIAVLYQKNEEQLINGSRSQHSVVLTSYESGALSNWWQSFINWVKELLFPAPLVSSEISSIVFDDDGAYGANQGSPRSRQGAEQQALYNIVRIYYPDYTDLEISHFMKKLNNEGCGYAAVINTIFAAFEGKEREFEGKFGFPMYGNDGDLNYDRLLVDFYSATDNHNKGRNGDYVNINEDANTDELKNSSYNYRTDVTGRGTSQYDRDYRTHLYLDQKGIPVRVKTDYKLTPQSFSKIADSGYIIISYRYGNLQNADGSTAQYVNGGHAMVVTGVTSDGRYVVSSWGKKYYIDPNEIIRTGGNTTSFTFSYYQYQ